MPSYDFVLATPPPLETTSDRPATWYSYNHNLFIASTARKRVTASLNVESKNGTRTNRKKIRTNSTDIFLN